MRAGILVVLLGGLFLFFGMWRNEGDPNYLLLGSGLLFAILGLSSIFSAIRLRQK